jgi:hypothetical protein
MSEGKAVVEGQRFVYPKRAIYVIPTCYSFLAILCE